MSSSTGDTLQRIIGLVTVYGPLLEELGVDLKKVYDFIRQHQSIPSLTVAERLHLHRILDADPATLGMPDVQKPPELEVPPPIPAPPPQIPPLPEAPPSTQWAYYEELGSIPVVGLVPGDKVYRKPNGKFVVTMHGFGTPIPSDWVLVLEVS